MVQAVDNRLSFHNFAFHGYNLAFSNDDEVIDLQLLNGDKTFSVIPDQAGNSRRTVQTLPKRAHTLHIGGIFHIITEGFQQQH
ncbi:hypothetical protein SDC9_197757 [bioreactor metagenome]|uniref:Uncharacterized protein n=1 Tax=bioreactor metagenome TaxID=1076179 RepID=A0A645IFN4_9ZZZZ